MIAQTFTAVPIDLGLEIKHLILGAIATLITIVIQEFRLWIKHKALMDAEKIAKVALTGEESDSIIKKIEQGGEEYKKAAKRTSERLGFKEELANKVEDIVHNGDGIPHKENGNA